MAKESIFSGLNNLKINSILDNKYSEYFGFTSEEVREMAEYYGKPEKYEEICKWYDGYRFGKTEIFNPWSVLNYVDNQCEPKAYWQATGSNDIIGEIISQATPEIILLLKFMTIEWRLYLQAGCLWDCLKRSFLKVVHCRETRN